MQQQVVNSSPPPLPNVISTEQIQKYLDENKNLIVAILENQNMGKIAECARYQAILQKNLMYLAAIADSQPQGSGMPSQLPTSSVALQGSSPVASTVLQQQQPGTPVANSPFQVNALQGNSVDNQGMFGFGSVEGR